ncbi:cofilin [Ceratobasidium sp. 428]|nr:cofilin [Ceratobasidium sp. 428]
MSKDLKEITVHKTSESTDYEDFLADLPEDDCRWAVYDFAFEKDGGKRNKLTFFIWSPDNAKIKQKMVYASSKDAIRKALVGIAAEIQGTESDEVAYETVFEKVSRGN